MGKKDIKSAPTAIDETDLDAVQGGAIQKVRAAASTIKCGVTDAPVDGGTAAMGDGSVRSISSNISTNGG